MLYFEPENNEEEEEIEAAAFTKVLQSNIHIGVKRAKPLNGHYVALCI